MTTAEVGDNSYRSLVHRLLACEYWRWSPGLPTNTDHVYLGEDADGDVIFVDGGSIKDGVFRSNLGEMINVGWVGPDVFSPIVKGWILSLIRKAWGPCCTMYLPRRGGIRMWRVVTFTHNGEWGEVSRILGEGKTELKAMINALESAP